MLQSLYTREVINDLPAVGIQLQAKNRDFWDTYDRHMAEAQFRYGIFLPMVVVIFIIAAQSGNGLWLFLLAVPAYLVVLGRRHSIEAASTLVQAVVLKMVTPPVIERLDEAVAKKRDQRREQLESVTSLGALSSSSARSDLRRTLW